MVVGFVIVGVVIVGVMMFGLVMLADMPVLMDDARVGARN